MATSESTPPVFTEMAPAPKTPSQDRKEIDAELKRNRGGRVGRPVVTIAGFFRDLIFVNLQKKCL